MPPRRSNLGARAGPSSRSRGDAGAGPSTSDRDHNLLADLRADLDVFVELVPRLLRLPGPDGLPLQPPGVTATRALHECFLWLEAAIITATSVPAILQSHGRVTELCVLLLRGDEANGLSAEQRKALEKARDAAGMLVQRVSRTAMHGRQAADVTWLPVLARKAARAGLLRCLACRAAEAEQHLGRPDGYNAACATVGLCEFVIQLVSRCACLVPATAEELEAALRDSHILQHTGRLLVLLRSAPGFDSLGYSALSSFNLANICLASRTGATDASRQLLGGWPLMALLAQSVAALQALDGGTAYGLPAELCFSAAQLRQVAETEASSGITELLHAVTRAASALSHGPVPLHGISRRGVLACMLRAGRLALSALAGGGRITLPDGSSHVLISENACSLAVRSLAASAHLLLPADAAAGWVQEGSVAVWQLAADMARVGSLQACAAGHGCRPAAFSTVFALLQEEFSKGGKAVCAWHVPAP
jgi:hypothetical protein